MTVEGLRGEEGQEGVQQEVSQDVHLVVSLVDVQDDLDIVIQ